MNKINYIIVQIREVFADTNNSKQTILDGLYSIAEEVDDHINDLEEDIGNE